MELLKILLFADHTLSFYIGEDVEIVAESITEELTGIYVWTMKNYLIISTHWSFHNFHTILFA